MDDPKPVQIQTETLPAELADVAAMFVVVRAKSNLAVLNGNLRKRPPASIHLREHLRQLGDVGRDAPRLVFAQ
jgi:hypothetical protein